MPETVDMLTICWLAYMSQEGPIKVQRHAHFKLMPFWSSLIGNGVQGEEVGTGLLTYPVLMAADILLYQVLLTSAPALHPSVSVGHGLHTASNHADHEQRAFYPSSQVLHHSPNL